jgi:hypothetical protein
LIQRVFDGSLDDYALEKVSGFPATSGNPFLGRKELGEE